MTTQNGQQSTQNLPKAILYAWPTSVWSTVPQLCLAEKGYSEDEYMVKNVDLAKGENFAPSYLKINMNGTIPTLVVPTYETTADEVDTRYRSLRDTTSICDFLDQARSAGSSNTVSDKPAPALAPATIEGKATSDQIIQMVHLPTVDPNFLNMSARNAEELASKRQKAPGKMLASRREGLKKYMAEAKEAANAGGSYEKKVAAFLETKAESNEVLYSLYNGQAGEEKEKAFYEASVGCWTQEIPSLLEKLEGIIKGPYTLGDQISLADLHIVAWLARITTVADGEMEPSGMDALQSQLGGKVIGPKVRGFWDAWVERDSFKKVLVPSARNFREAAGN